MTLQDVVNEVFLRVGTTQARSAAVVTPSRVMDLVNMGMNSMRAEAMRINPDCFKSIVSAVTLVKDVAYTLPDYVTYFTDIRDSQTLLPIRRMDYDQGAQGRSWGYEVHGRQLFLRNIGQCTVDIRVETAWPALHYGTAQAGSTAGITFATTATAGTIILTDDAYNRMRVVLHAGTGLGQSAFVTDYNGTSKIAAATWTVAPNNTTQYGVMPPWDEICDELLVYSALSRFSQEAFKQAANNDPVYASLRMAFEQWAARQNSQGRPISRTLDSELVSGFHGE